MPTRLLPAVTLLAMSLCAAGAQGSAAASQAGLSLHGIALGARATEIAAGAGLPCHASPVGDMLCNDPAETGSDFKATMSGGSPAVAIAVAHAFCSRQGIDRVLAEQMRPFGVRPEAAQTDPNGYFFDIGAMGEGVLNGNDGTCQDGSRRYEFSIRNDQLMKDSFKQARQRVKASRG